MEKICKNCKSDGTRICKKIKSKHGVAFGKPFTLIEYPGEKESCGYFDPIQEDNK